MTRAKRFVGRSNRRLRKTLHKTTPRIRKRKRTATKFLRKSSIAGKRTLKRFKPRR